MSGTDARTIVLKVSSGAERRTHPAHGQRYIAAHVGVVQMQGPGLATCLHRPKAFLPEVEGLRGCQ